MQAIHHAATTGQVEVMMMLIQHFGVSPQEKGEVGNYCCAESLVKV